MIELKLKNYRRFLTDPGNDDEFHQVIFEPGLIIVTGPNGSGKTTLVEALSYGLYGLKFKSLRKKEITPDNAIGGTEVILELEIDNQPVRVRRWSNCAELWVNDALQVEGISGSVSRVHQQLSALLGGLTPEQFEHTYFAKQGDTSGLVEVGSGSQRKQIIAQILQLDVLQEAVEIQEERLDSSLRDVKAQGRVISDSDEFQFGSEERDPLQSFSRARTTQSRLEYIGRFQSRVEVAEQNFQQEYDTAFEAVCEAQKGIEKKSEQCTSGTAP